MPAIVATFRADLTQFERALAGGTTHVNAFSRSTAQVNRELAKFGNEFPGANIQRQALTMARAVEDLGGVSRLTAGEQQRLAASVDEALAKYRALGQQAPPQLQRLKAELDGVRASQDQANKSLGGFSSVASQIRGQIAGAFAVGTIVNFAKEVVDLGGEITDLSERAGTTTDAIQEFKYIADQTGSTVDTFTGAMSQLNNRLTEGGKGTVGALRELNLSIEQLRTLDPADALERVAEAIADVPEPMRQTQLAMELMGKAGIETLPAIRAGFADLRKEAHETGQVISKDAVKALDEFGDVWGRTFGNAKAQAAQAFLVIRDDFSTIGDSAQTAMINTAQVFFKPFGDAARKAQLEVRAIDKAIRDMAIPKGPSQFQAENPLALRNRANAPASEDRARLDQIAEDFKASQEAAKQWAEEVRKAYEEAVGVSAQREIKKIQDAFSLLSGAQRANQTTVRNLLQPYEDLRQKVRDLPRDLERLRAEVQKPLKVTFTSGDLGIVGLPPDLSRRTAEFRNELEGLRRDGLLPATAALKTLHTDAEGVTRTFHGYQTIVDASAIRTNNLAGQFRNAADEAKHLEDVARGLDFADLGESLASALTGAFTGGGGLAEAIRGVGDIFASQIQQSVRASVQKGLQDKTLSAAGAFAQSAGGAAAGAIMGAWVDQLIAFINSDKNEEKARIAGAALSSQFVAGFGGPQAFRDLAERAGATAQQIARAMSSIADPETVQRGIAEVTPLIDKYRQTLEGLGTAAGGANTFSEALEKQFERSAALTAENIDRINNLGLIIGGTIANTAGRTGDLVQAVLAVGPALENLDQLRDKFNLAGELSPATAEVLKLYDTIKGNEDVFQAISGIGQVMTGLGDALVRNTPLANAFGQELAAQFQILKDRGVDANLALASMAPQLQQLWELSQAGKITVDETTAALLEEAEAIGVVGDAHRSQSEQIIGLLTEIRDLFAEHIPSAIARTADGLNNVGNQGRDGLARARDAGKDLAATLNNEVTTSASRAGDRIARVGSDASEAFERARHRGIVPVIRTVEDLTDLLGLDMTQALDLVERGILDESAIAQAKLREQIDLWERTRREMERVGDEADEVGRKIREKIPSQILIDVEYRYPDGERPDDVARPHVSGGSPPIIPGPALGATSLAPPISLAAPATAPNMINLSVTGTIEGDPIIRFVARNIGDYVDRHIGGTRLS